MVEESGALIPSGVIVMWSGLISEIPGGWALCDGQGGRPDLRSKFVKGAPAGQNPGQTGGTLTHTHGTQPLTTSTKAADQKIGTAAVKATDGHSHTVDIPNAGHEPPYYTVAFIIKL